MTVAPAVGVVTRFGQRGPRHARRAPGSYTPAARSNHRFPSPPRFRGAPFNPYEHASGRWQRPTSTRMAAHGWGSPAAARRMTRSSSATRASATQSPASPTTTRSPHTMASRRFQPTSTVQHRQAPPACHRRWAGRLRRLPIWQSRSHLQFIINRVAATADLVAIVHPESRNALRR